MTRATATATITTTAAAQSLERENEGSEIVDKMEEDSDDDESKSRSRQKEAEGEDENNRVADNNRGPTLTDPTRARNADEEAERFMLLASATNTIVWPLYSVGMSSLCTPAMRAYVVDRLMAIFHETGLKQAETIAAIVRSRELVAVPEPSDPWTSIRARSPPAATADARLLPV